MALGYLDDSKLTAIAEAIRDKTGKSATMTVDEMPDEIESISGGGEIGPFYDGVSHLVIYVSRDSYEVTLNMYCANAGDVSVSWGDGSTSAWPHTGRGDVSHVYATAGLYNITFPHSSDKLMTFGGSSMSDAVFKTSTSGQKPYRQTTMLRYAEIANGDRLNGYAFYNCAALEKVTIGNAFWSVGDYVFSGCWNLKSVLGLENITSALGQYFFNYCTTMPAVPQSALKSSISAAQFYACYSLSSIEVPGTVTEIKAQAFRYCSDLQYVKMLGTAPPTLANVNAFGGASEYPIYVPSSAVESYKAASVWANLASRIMADPNE